MELPLRVHRNLTPHPASSMDSTPQHQGLFDTERFRLFVSNVADYAIFMLTPQGYISSWNRGAQRCKGYTPDEIIGEHFSRFYTEEERAAGKPALALRVAREQGKYEDEGWRVRKDGSQF